ncbi:disulfide bond formation protein DsbA [Rhodoblastus sphagnicola]|uniref:2-hydroxychromene-2-carboxylate isomerase n=1 Tax=Rhodoblastus sphagnicola TaxID=333368 RepID=A0A2S6NHW5_9HYPH|nr:2-hydroxychromene-2-carboxylate isomerase [Rhodoblastus sphagnicola]MBB4196737.1 2-hydroxychromene-2-carboxylate isomerase [Rhodoblastus sphagnicola]PPQ34191.1 disulfide bond formation protein DsbA [Rhodoblastus sphagnicola]
MGRQLTVYFSLLSPWAYIGHSELRRLAEKHALTLDYRPVDLMEVFPESGGLPLGKRHPSRQAYRLVELQRWREKRGLDFHLWPRFWPFDPTRADRTICALAADKADPQKFIAGAFAAIFEQNRDIADENEIAAVLSETGYPSSWLTRATNAETATLYETNRTQALAAGVFGSPSYLLDGEIFWGQDRLDLLDDALTSNRPPFTAPD